MVITKKIGNNEEDPCMVLVEIQKDTLGGNADVSQKVTRRASMKHKDPTSRCISQSNENKYSHIT